MVYACALGAYGATRGGSSPLSATLRDKIVGPTILEELQAPLIAERRGGSFIVSERNYAYLLTSSLGH